MEKKLNICPYMIDLTPNIILSKPQLGENIGSTARAMKNFGIEKLRLIEPVSYTHLTLPTIYSV